MAVKSPSRIPHPLRMAIFLLRLAIGLNFLYFGLAVLFNPSLGADLHGRSFSDLYTWLSANVSTGWVHPFAQWAFLIIGACLILGLATRVASIVGVAVVLVSFLPNVSYVAPSVGQFVSDEVIAIICLLILLVGDAGTYIGVDSFIHISFRRKQAQ